MANLDNLVNDYITGGAIDTGELYGEDDPYSHIEDKGLRRVADFILKVLKPGADVPDLGYLPKKRRERVSGQYRPYQQRLEFQEYPSMMKKDGEWIEPSYINEETILHELTHFLDDLEREDKEVFLRPGEKRIKKQYASGDIGYDPTPLEAILNFYHGVTSQRAIDEDDLSKGFELGPIPGFSRTQTYPQYKSSPKEFLAHRPGSEKNKQILGVVTDALLGNISEEYPIDITNITNYIEQQGKMQGLENLLMDKYFSEYGKSFYNKLDLEDQSRDKR